MIQKTIKKAETVVNEYDGTENRRELSTRIERSDKYQERTQDLLQYDDNLKLTCCIIDAATFAVRSTSFRVQRRDWRPGEDSAGS